MTLCMACGDRTDSVGDFKTQQTAWVEAEALRLEEEEGRYDAPRELFLDGTRVFLAFEGDVFWQWESSEAAAILHAKEHLEPYLVRLKPCRPYTVGSRHYVYMEDVLQESVRTMQPVVFY